MDNLKKLIEDIYFYKLRVSFEVSEDLYLPEYKGAAFRGCFGEAFKKLKCKTRDGKCLNEVKNAIDKHCKEIFDCEPAFFFERPLKPEHPLFRRYTKPPRPYILIPMDGNKTEFKTGEYFFFDFVLIGESVNYLGLLKKVFTKMGKIGIGEYHSKFKLSKIECFNSSNSILPLNEGELPIKITINDLPKFKIETNLEITFLNPARFLNKRAPIIESPSFNVFIEVLARRISLLSYLYCNGKWVDSEKIEVLKTDAKILTDTLIDVNWKRWSGTKGMNLKFDGKKGVIIYQGVPNYLSDLINIGTWLHIASTATFGLGKYSVQTYE